MPDNNEPYAGGNLFDPNAFNVDPSKARGQRNQRGGGAGGAGGSLKFDIPGLKDFKSELNLIHDALRKLDDQFKKMVDAPKKWADQLERINKELKGIKDSGGDLGKMLPTGGGEGGGAQALISASGSRTQGGFLSGLGKFANVLGKGGGATATGAEMGAGAAAEGGMMAGAAAAAPPIAAAMAAKQVAETIKAAMAQGMQAMFQRFDENMEENIQLDAYQGRRAMAVGAKSHELTTQMGLKGFSPTREGAIPFYARDMVEAGRVLDAGQAVGAIYGAEGIAGQRGQACAESIGQTQMLNPGMNPTQAAGRFDARVSNVSGMQQGLALFGPKVSPYKQGGKMKTDVEFYRDVMSVLMRIPRQNGKQGQPFSKISIQAMATPGSWAESNLIAMGLSNDDIQGFWNWAITNATSVESGQGELSTNMNAAQDQMEKTTGQLTSRENQVLESNNAQRNAAMAGEQYGTQLTRIEMEQQVTRLLDGLDSWLQGLYNVTGVLPSGVQDLATSIVSGDPGYMGDAERGLSHLTPDLRKRVGRMMGDNPRLRVNSAYRDSRRQSQLQAGGGPFAPAGKSAHGRGQAIDLGPSSEHGWMAANAAKYGIDMAGHMGEPWHAQLKGSLGFMGDPDVNGSGMGDPTVTSMRARQGEAGLQAAYMGVWSQIRTEAAMAAQAAAGMTGAVGGAVGAVGEAVGTAFGGGAGGAPAGGMGVGELKDVPNYAGAGTHAIKGTPLAMADLVQVVAKAGFTGDDIWKMAAIAMRESGGGAYRYAYVPKTKDKSYGMWMQNAWDEGMANEMLTYVKAGGGSKLEDLYDPQISANATYQQWKRYGWRPWGPYKGVSETHGVKDEWLQSARAAAQQAGFIGDAGYASGVNNGSGSTNNIKVAPVQFSNTFNITMSGTRSDVDVATRQIAQRLEVQVQRLVSRRS